jgi:hypothetical protein
MNTAQKRLLILGFTVLLTLFACLSAYGQASSPTERYVFYADAFNGLYFLYAPEPGKWTDGHTGPGPNPIGSMTVVNSATVVEFDYINSNEVADIGGGNLSGWGGGCPSCVGAPAPAPGSTLTSFVDASGPVRHVFYEGTNGHVYELYCFCNSVGATWHWDDPTSLARGAPLAASGSALTSFIDNGVMHVFYLGTNANVYELYWTGGTAWHSDNPTSLAGAPAAASVGSLTSFIDGSGIMHVFYLSGQNVHELYWNGVWHTDDATSQAGAPLNASGSALTSFVNITGKGDTGMHVMYLGTNEHVYALHSTSSPAWGYFDATAASGGVPVVSGGKLTSFQDTVTGGVRLYFIGQNAHVYELYWPSEGAASETDLTTASSASETAATGSALAGVMMPPN